MNTHRRRRCLLQARRRFARRGARRASSWWRSAQSAHRRAPDGTMAMADGLSAAVRNPSRIRDRGLRRNATPITYESGVDHAPGDVASLLLQDLSIRRPRRCGSDAGSERERQDHDQPEQASPRVSSGAQSEQGRNYPPVAEKRHLRRAASRAHRRADVRLLPEPRPLAAFATAAEEISRWLETVTAVLRGDLLRVFAPTHSRRAHDGAVVSWKLSGERPDVGDGEAEIPLCGSLDRLPSWIG